MLACQEPETPFPGEATEGISVCVCVKFSCLPFVWAGGDSFPAASCAGVRVLQTNRAIFFKGVAWRSLSPRTSLQSLSPSLLPLAQL